MKKTIEALSSAKLVPVVKIESERDALSIAKAVLKGGISVMEVTFRTEAAEKAIKEIADSLPEMFVGAGTLLSKEQVRAAKNAGAKFFVSPGFNENTADFCKSENLPFMPGIVTPSELEKALYYGFDHLKFFPAEAAGGVKMIKAVSAPYHGVKFMPTGGINLENLLDYLALPSVFACGGSFMINQKEISSGNFESITEAVKKAVELINKF